LEAKNDFPPAAGSFNWSNIIQFIKFFETNLAKNVSTKPITKCETNLAKNISTKPIKGLMGFISFWGGAIFLLGWGVGLKPSKPMPGYVPGRRRSSVAVD